MGLLGTSFALGPAHRAVAAPNNFVTMPDGVQIAINVRLPEGYQAGRRYPTVFEMSGYDGGSAEGHTLVTDLGLQGVPVLPADDSRQLTDRFDAQYVTIHASVRGTGCSSGEFDLFSRKSAEDGKYIIDNYIPNQPWSNGDVAYISHSYGGITGFMIAETQPTHLRVISVSGLIDDMYRGITYPGGVSNYGFPLAWTGAIRPAYDLLGGTAPGIFREEEPDDVQNRRVRCANNQLEKRRTVIDDPLVQGLNDTDSEWFRAAVADHGRRSHQRADSHHRRIPGRADRPARPHPLVGAGARCPEAACAHQRQPRHAESRATRVPRCGPTGRRGSTTSWV